LALGLAKNSGFDSVLKGRGFGRAVSAAKSTPALAYAGTRNLQCHFPAACQALSSSPETHPEPFRLEGNRSLPQLSRHNGLIMSGVSYEVQPH